MVCIMTHCLKEMNQCYFDKPCMDILNCFSDCEPDDAECNFTCGMGTDALKNPHFMSLMQCMVENECLDKYPESGACLATNDQALDISDFDLVRIVLVKFTN